MSTNNIHTDKPIDEKSLDRFQRYEFSKRIAAIIATPKNDKSIVIGLYGKWGEGKSTIMNFIRKELPDETIIVNFNPWLFSDERSLLKSFFESVVFALGESSQTTKEKIGKFISEYSGALGIITHFVGGSANDFKEVANTLQNTSIEKLKERVDNLIIESGKNIVVFIDDIDRLDVNEIQYIFKVVKLVGDFPRTSYVLSFDDEIVSTALAPKYGNANSGYLFLEKIIQIPIKIPKATQKALRHYTIELINNVLKDINQELDDNDMIEFVEIFDSAFLPFIHNPRIGIRYANTLTFSLPLLIGEVNLGNLMIIEGLKIFYPNLYEFIRNNHSLFLTNTSNVYDSYAENKREDIKKEISIALETYDLKKKKIIIDFLQRLFPQLKAIYSSTSYTEDSYKKWSREKKICSGKYFNRYFSYVVQEGEISDKYFSDLLNGLQTVSDEIISNKLAKDLKVLSPFDLIFKLRMWEENLNEVQSKTLSLALCRLGDFFPIEEDIHFATTYAQSASLIARLIRNVTKGDQLSLVQKILRETKPFSYAFEIHYWIMYRENKDPIFIPQDILLMEMELLSIFRKQLNTDNLFSLLSENNLSKIFEWWSKQENIKEDLDRLLIGKLNAENDFALKFIKVFTPTIISTIHTGKQSSRREIYKSGFNKSYYEAIKSVIDISKLYEKTKQIYGDVPFENDVQTLSDRDTIDDITLIAIFQKIYIEDNEINIGSC